MSLFRGRLFAGALYAGLLFGGQPVTTPEPAPIPESAGAGVESQAALWQQIREEDELILSLLQVFVTEN